MTVTIKTNRRCAKHLTMLFSTNWTNVGVMFPALLSGHHFPRHRRRSILSFAAQWRTRGLRWTCGEWVPALWPWWTWRAWRSWPTTMESSITRNSRIGPSESTPSPSGMFYCIYGLRCLFICLFVVSVCMMLFVTLKHTDGRGQVQPSLLFISLGYRGLIVRSSVP